MNLQIKKSSLNNLLICAPLFLMIIYIGGVFSPVMKVSSALMSLDLESTLSHQSGSNIAKQIFWVSMLFLSAINYLKYGGAKFKKSTSFLLFALIIGLCITSVFWTEYPNILFKRVILQLILIISIALSISSLRSQDRLLKVIFNAFSLIAIYNSIFIIIFPHFSFDNSFALSGIYKAKNYLGFVSLAGLIISKNTYDQLNKNGSTKISIFFIVLWGIFLALSQSKTCIFVGALFSLLWLINVSKYLEDLLGIFLVFCLVLFYLVLPLYSSAFMGGGFISFNDIFQYVDLTGRGEIWSLAIDSLEGSKMFGVGYGSFWGTGIIPENFDIRYSYLMFLNQSHNGYLDVLIQLGFIGLSLFLLFLITFVKNEFKKLMVGFKYLIIFVLIHNITESSLLRDTHLMWILLLIVIISSWFDLKKSNSVSYNIIKIKEL